MRRFYKIDPRLHIDKLSDLIDEPKIIRVNEFDEESLEDFERDMDVANATGQPVIPIVIDSYGGSVYACLGFIAAIESARVPVATILTAKAMSAGAVLFCFGTDGYRYMHPHARMMFHDMSAGSVGKTEEIKADAKNLEYLNTTMFARVSMQLGHKPRFLQDLIEANRNADWFLSAKEAKRLNIANHLRVPYFETEISMKMTFN